VTELRIFYVLASHRAGPERRLIMHAVTPDLARRMTWADWKGSRQHWSLSVIEATNFESIKEIILK